MAVSRDSPPPSPPTKRRKVEAVDDDEFLGDDIDGTDINLNISNNQETHINITEDTETRISRHTTLLSNILDSPNAKAIPEVRFKEIQDSLSVAALASNYVVFLGEQGSGKSSAINSVLRLSLLPTDSSGEACTAIPIEVHGTEKPGDFTGEVTFIKPEEWRAEVTAVQTALCQGLNDEFDHKERDRLLKKMETVYPALKVSDIRTKSVDEILTTNDAHSKLGKTESISNDDWHTFRDSLYKLTVDKFKPAKAGQSPPFQVWPLIEVVKVYVDSTVLRNGLVLVDVPGVLDSNRARANRAMDYIGCAFAVCIVAPAQRAVSNSTAHELLRDALEQVQYGGHLDRVILLNSKSDDFKQGEVQQRFDDPRINDISNKKRESENDLEVGSEQLRDKESKLRLAQSLFRDRNLDIQLYKRKLKKILAGGVEYASGIRIDGHLRAPKPKGKPLTENDVRVRLQEYTDGFDDAESSCGRLKLEVASLKGDVMRAEQHKAEYEQAYFDICLAVRNEMVIAKQKAMYAKIVRDNHEVAAAVAKSGVEQKTVTEVEIKERHGDLIAKLPVFCISAKAYQQLENIHQSNKANMFKDIEQTQVPAFRDHLIALAEHARDEILQNTLRKLELTLHSIYLYVMESAESRVVDQAQVGLALEEVTRNLNTFSDQLSGPASDAGTILQQKLTATLLSKHNTIIEKVASNAIKRMAPFGEHPVGNDSLGLFPVEYKAGVCHGGVWIGKRVKFDWNQRVARRLQVGTGAYMSRLYTDNNSHAIHAIKDAERACKDVFMEVQRFMELHAGNAGVNAHAWVLAKDQLGRREEFLAEKFRHAQREIRNAPNSAIKYLFTDIEHDMQPGYKDAQKVCQGAGARAAMSAKVLEHIGQSHGKVFDKALKKIERGLTVHIEKVTQELKRELEDLAVRTKTDYESAFANLDGVVLTTSDPVKNELRGQLLASGLVSYNATSICKEDVQDEADADMEYTFVS